MADGKRIALVIGNSAYLNASALKNPVNDARDIADVLKRLGFSGVNIDSPIASITNDEPLVPLFDLAQMRLRKALAAFARVAEHTDQAVLYYAGHGIEVGGRNYLIPIDATLEDAKDVSWETTALDELLISIEDGSGLRLIILDACRDNPFRGRMISTRTLSRGLASVQPNGNDIIVAYSSEHGKVALDGTERNSPYVTALLKYLEVPGLEVWTIFREVSEYVREITKQRQKPFTYGQLGRREYYFVPVPSLGRFVVGEAPGDEGSLMQSDEVRESAADPKVTEFEALKSDSSRRDQDKATSAAAVRLVDSSTDLAAAPAAEQPSVPDFAGWQKLEMEALESNPEKRVKSRGASLPENLRPQKIDDLPAKGAENESQFNRWLLVVFLTVSAVVMLALAQLLSLPAVRQ